MDLSQSGLYGMPGYQKWVALCALISLSLLLVTAIRSGWRWLSCRLGKKALAPASPPPFLWVARALVIISSVVCTWATYQCKADLLRWIALPGSYRPDDPRAMMRRLVEEMSVGGLGIVIALTAASVLLLTQTVPGSDAKPERDH